MKNAEIADVLEEIADFLEIQDVEYKPRAYRTAARNVRSLSEPIEDVYERGELEDVEGVGESIAEKIAEYLETGELGYYEELKADLPIDIEAITRVQGVGPKTARTLYRELDVRTLKDLEQAAASGRIATVEGFGEKTEQNILENIERAKTGQDRMLLGRAFPIAATVEERLSASAAFDRVDIVGSFRRRRPTVGDIDVLASASDHDAAIDEFCEHDDVTDVLAKGGTKASVVASGDVQMDLRIVDDAEYGAALVYFTGSKAHNIALRNRAIDRDWKLNEYGLFDVAADADAETDGTRQGEVIASESESDVYDALDLAYIPPELREETGEIEAAASDALPDLVELEDVRGDLQTHTDASDGSPDVRELAEAAADRGYEYVLVSDHGPNAPIPSTLDAGAFHAQCDEVAELNADDDVDVTVLQGIEAEITENGIDLPPDILDACDVVVGALHASPSDPTDRIVAAIESGDVDVLAHPSNRLIHERDPLELDMARIASAAAENQVAIEINAQPERLDLDWEAVKEYRDTVQYVISTDAHTTGELDFMHLGVAQARRGWCEPATVLNTRPLDELLAFVDG